MMSTLSAEEKNGLADVQFKSLELFKTPVTDYDVTQKLYVDTKFSAAVTSSTAAVTALIDGAPQQLNTLKELSSALLDNANLGSVLTSQISSVSASVTAEAATRASTDASHLGYINRNYDLIVQEQTDRAQNVASLQTSIGQVFTALQDEGVVRQAGDVGLLNTINADRLTRASGDTALHQRVDAETLERQQADSTLSARVTDETKFREEAVTTLSATKQDVSPFISFGSEQMPTIADGAYLYIGSNWRIAASTAGQAKRLEFQHNSGAPNEAWRTAVPFVRPAPQ